MKTGLSRRPGILEKSLGPNDYVAVFLLGTDFRLLQEFTNDKTRLAAVLSRRDTGQLSLTQAGESNRQPRLRPQATPYKPSTSRWHPPARHPPTPMP